MTPKRALLALLAAALLGAGLAGGAVATVSATGTITGSGKSYKLKITNTGTEPIKCWRLTLPVGVEVTAVGATPAGWQVGAPGPLPQPVIGGKSNAGIPPGGSAEFAFTTDNGFPAGLTTALRVSGDCKTDVTAVVTGPSGGGDTPKAKCRCKSFEITAGRYNRLRSKQGYVAFELEWQMTCAPKSGGRCTGKIEVVAPGARVEIVVPEDGKRVCQGTCKAVNEGPAYVGVLGLGEREGKTFRFKINKFCFRNGKYVAVGSQAVELAFDGNGRLDKVQSDLNANGTPDGDEKK